MQVACGQNAMREKQRKSNALWGTDKEKGIKKAKR